MSEAIERSTPSAYSGVASNSAGAQQQSAHLAKNSPETTARINGDYYDAGQQPEPKGSFIDLHTLAEQEMRALLAALLAIVMQEQVPMLPTTDVHISDIGPNAQARSTHRKKPVRPSRTALAHRSKPTHPGHSSRFAPAGPHPTKTARHMLIATPNERRKIHQQALAWKGKFDGNFGVNTANACVATVNNIVHMATGKWLGGDPSVNNIDALRKNGDVTRIAQASAQPGDFMIVDSADKSAGHIGICMNKGCTDVLSNSSGKGTFSFESDHNDRFNYPGSPYQGGTASYWRAVLK